MFVVLPLGPLLRLVSFVDNTASTAVVDNMQEYIDASRIPAPLMDVLFFILLFLADDDGILCSFLICLVNYLSMTNEIYTVGHLPFNSIIYQSIVYCMWVGRLIQERYI